MFKIFLFVILISSVNILHAQILKQHIEYLSSDSLEGRKPGQSGNKLATKYIKEELEKLNITPLSDDYLQEFTIFTQMSKQGQNYFKVGSLKSSFEPITYSLNGQLEDKKLVFVGFGISIPKNDPNLIYDDYRGINVKDKIVIAFTGDPGVGNIKSYFRKPEYQNYGSLFYKLKNAITHGAAGIIIVQNPMSLENYPHENPPFFNASEGGGSRFSILSGKVSNHFLDKLLSSSLKSIDLQSRISKTQKPFSFELKKYGSLSVDLKKQTGRVSNIVGLKEGSDPKLKKEVIVLGAHMDHLGFGGDSSLEPSGSKKIHNGADDNASGSAMILNLAKSLAQIPSKRSIVYVLFNAEEMGLLGSKQFVERWAQYEQTYGKIVAMLNFDMIGRYTDSLSIMGLGSADIFGPTLRSTEALGLKRSFKNSLIGSSDHAPFIENKIPSLFFTTGAHEDYHRSTDDSEKINYVALKKMSPFFRDFIVSLDNIDEIKFNEHFNAGAPSDGQRGYGAHLGCVPEFGQSDSIKGVVCMRASKGSPAEGVGIKKGDILVQIGTIEIKSIYDLAFALKYYRAGDKVEIAWKRESSLLKSMLTLASSKR